MLSMNAVVGKANGPFVAVVVRTKGISPAFGQAMQETVVHSLRSRNPGRHPHKPVYTLSSVDTPLALPVANDADEVTTATPRKRKGHRMLSYTARSKGQGEQPDQQLQVDVYCGSDEPYFKIIKADPKVSAAIDPILPPSLDGVKSRYHLIPPHRIERSRAIISRLPPRTVSQAEIMGVSAEAIAGRSLAQLAHVNGRAEVQRSQDDVLTEPKFNKGDLAVASSGANLSTDTRIDHLKEHMSNMSEGMPLQVSTKVNLLPHPTIPNSYTHVSTKKTVHLRHIAPPGHPLVNKELTIVANTWGDQPTRHTYGFFKQVAGDVMSPKTRTLTDAENVKPNVLGVF